MPARGIGPRPRASRTRALVADFGMSTRCSSGKSRGLRAEPSDARKRHGRGADDAPVVPVPGLAPVLGAVLAFRFVDPPPLRLPRLRFDLDVRAGRRPQGPHVRRGLGGPLLRVDGGALARGGAPRLDALLLEHGVPLPRHGTRELVDGRRPVDAAFPLPHEPILSLRSRDLDGQVQPRHDDRDFLTCALKKSNLIFSAAGRSSPS